MLRDNLFKIEISNAINAMRFYMTIISSYSID